MFKSRMQESGQKGQIMKVKIIVLYARQWAMVDEVTGESRSGVSIQYVMSDSFAPNEEKDEKGNLVARGYQVIKESISVDCAAGLQDTPGYYEAEFTMKAQGGKNVLHVCGLKFLSPLVK